MSEQSLPTDEAGISRADTALPARKCPYCRAARELRNKLDRGDYVGSEG